MINEYVESRISELYKYLFATYEAGRKLSSASKGSERELVINGFLREVLPITYRLASGDITDSYNNKSGQLDVVIEKQNAPSFPVYPFGPRLFFAEGVSCVIEVKSNLKNQWAEVESTYTKLRQVKRMYSGSEHKKWSSHFEALARNQNPSDAKRSLRAVANIFKQKAVAHNDEPKQIIPFYVIAFESGWVTPNPLKERLNQLDDAGVFVIDKQWFYNSDGWGNHGNKAMLDFLTRVIKDVEHSGSFSFLSKLYLAESKTDPV